MKQRSPIAATLLSFFIPFYILYWFYVTAKEIQQRGIKTPSFSLMLAPFFAMAALIIIALFQSLFHNTSSSTKLTINLISLVVGILAFVAILLPYAYYWSFSYAAREVTAGKITRWVSFVLLAFIAPVAVYIIQDALNNTSTPATSTPASTSTPPVNSATPPEVTALPSNPVTG